MKAAVIGTVKGVRDGEVYPVEFQDGDEVEGALARALVLGLLATPEDEEATALLEGDNA